MCVASMRRRRHSDRGHRTHEPEGGSVPSLPERTFSLGTDTLIGIPPLQYPEAGKIHTSDAARDLRHKRGVPKRYTGTGSLVGRGAFDSPDSFIASSQQWWEQFQQRAFRYTDTARILEYFNQGAIQEFLRATLPDEVNGRGNLQTISAIRHFDRGLRKLRGSEAGGVGCHAPRARPAGIDSGPGQPKDCKVTRAAPNSCCRETWSQWPGGPKILAGGVSPGIECCIQGAPEGAKDLGFNEFCRPFGA